MRILLNADPFEGYCPPNRPRHAATHYWPARWIALPEGARPRAAAYRLRFRLDSPAAFRLHVAADERYELYLDGAEIGRGSDLGDETHWYFDSHDLSLAAGEHTLVARLWSIGQQAPWPQVSLRPGLLVCPDPDSPLVGLLATGAAAWQAKPLGGYEFDTTTRRPAWPVETHDAARICWDFAAGAGGGWADTAVFSASWDWPWLVGEAHGCGASNRRLNSHVLRPSMLPPLHRVLRQPGCVRAVQHVSSPDTAALPVPEAATASADRDAWQRLCDGGAVAVPANTAVRAILDMGDYVCGRPVLTLSGGRGGEVRIAWAEALYGTPDGKGDSKAHRDRVDSLYFVGWGDRFLADGEAGRRFETYWWHAGRYLEIYVRAAGEPLTIDCLQIAETRYPLEMEGDFAAGDERLARLTPILVRALQECAHDTYMDCPYYEQQMWVGDTRPQMLCGYVMTPDDRLQRKSLQLIAGSRGADDLPAAYYPGRGLLVVPGFSLWFVAMVYDHMMYRGDAAYTATLMPAVRRTMDAIGSRRAADGLLAAPPGWNYVDWAAPWQHGIAPDGQDGVSAVLNWQTVLVLDMVARLEAWLGEKELAVRATRHAARLAAACRRAFWHHGRKLMADDLARKHFSEHTQCMALLSGRLTAAQRSAVAAGLVNAPDLTRCQIFFSHYLFEAYAAARLGEAIFHKLDTWHWMVEHGFKTTPETVPSPRSDCHAWAAHPLFHYYATILGIRPAAPGFALVDVAPLPGPLEHVRGRMPHPRGWVQAEFRFDHSAGRAIGRVALPPQTTGTLHLCGREIPLASGENQVEA
jgi:hypothetical protein